MINWILNKTENVREWIAFKIYPEFDWYIEIAKRLGEMNENSRATRLLNEADSACSGWATEVIKFDRGTFQNIMDKIKEGQDEVPF